MTESSPQVYEKSDFNSVGRMPERGRYDYATVHQIVKDSPFVHVSFLDDDEIMCIPMIGALTEEEDGQAYVYLHGHSKARLIRVLPPGSKLTITASHIDGYVLALSAFHHSMNYRSACIFGEVIPCDEPKEQMEAARLIVDSVVEERWDNCRVPNEAEMRTTGYLKVKVLRASAKVRTGPPSDDLKDKNDLQLSNNTWVGVIPLKLTAGTPEPASYNKMGVVPEHIISHISKMNGTQ